ncbi:hypothetical protein WMY93_006532 [Mugilogobius chulae]|uniref:Structure-specific endonuclease subunit SLX4 n=1 Tax=Mugilogobius chulae TaxID=88201 RepID=A0AAW0PTR9_9GOBI
MIHESGFGVQEEGVPAAQRVLLNDVPGPAVFALLQYLYTAHCSFPFSLQPYILELASRFDLKDLLEFCQPQEECEDTQTDEAFDELLRSMWNDEDTDDEGTEHNTFNSKEMDDQPGELRLGDREIQDEHVNEDELVEIYEFAATQKKREEEKEVYDEDQPEISANPTKIDEAKKSDSVSTSLDRSYNRLFSESWADFEEKDLSNLPEHKSVSRVHLPARLLPSEMSARTLLQSSASVIDKSPSPPRNAPNMPFPGVSPGLPTALSPDQVGFCGGGGGADEILKKSKNECVETHSSPVIFKPVLSQTSSKCKEPELVVLSDSSDDMNIDLTQCSSSPSPQKVKSFTNIKEQNTPNSKDLIADKIGDLTPAGEASLEDCSAEISWLIVSTPVQPEKSVRTSSSQTKSSICRARLFPKNEDSVPNSFSASKRSFSSSETNSRKSSLEFTSHKKMDSSGFAVPQSPSKYSHLENLSCSHQSASKQDTPLPVPAYSSTPVQTEISKLLPTSPFRAKNVAPDKMSTSPEKIPSFHLSPLSEQSYSRSKSSTKSDNNSRLSDCNKVQNEKANLVKKDSFEAEDGESSFRQSFMDEPPMAFNDSWGLDACAENPCFSLKLDDSEGSVQQQESLENIKTTTSITSIATAPDKQCDAGMSIIVSSNRTSSKESYPPETEAAQNINSSLMDSKIWDISNFKKRQALVPITPMPHYSDMDTPELKNKLNKFGVRPLPKRQMVLKLKEIHQYTHQLVSSDSEDEASSAVQKPTTTTTTITTSPIKLPQDEEPLSASQGSNTSSTAESERSNPEIVQLSDGDSDSDGGISASQSASRLQDRLKAVRAFILSDSSLYNQILQYQPLVLSQLQQQLKAAGIRLGVTKLADYLDSQCITFTTAKPGQSGPSKRRVKKTKAVGDSGKRHKKATSTTN